MRAIFQGAKDRLGMVGAPHFGLAWYPTMVQNFLFPVVDASVGGEHLFFLSLHRVPASHIKKSSSCFTFFPLPTCDVRARKCMEEEEILHFKSREEAFFSLS